MIQCLISIISIAIYYFYLCFPLLDTVIFSCSSNHLILRPTFFFSTKIFHTFCLMFSIFGLRSEFWRREGQSLTDKLLLSFYNFYIAKHAFIEHPRDFKIPTPKKFQPSFLDFMIWFICSFSIGKYAYMEASSQRRGNKAWLVSDYFKSSTTCFRFSYYIYDTSSGMLKVYQQILGRTKTLQWSETNRSSEFRWLDVSITLPYAGFNSDYRVSFKTITNFSNVYWTIPLIDSWYTLNYTKWPSFYYR